MNAIALLEKQLSNVHTIFKSVAGDLTDDEWVARPAAGQNLIGYTVWHLPRVQDNFVQIWIRGVPEVAHRDRWAQWGHLRHLGVGVGITLQEADEIARSVRRDDVLEYAEAVYQENVGWLRTLNDADLDRAPDMRLHLSPYPEYQTHTFVEEVSNLYEQPIWSLLMRPCHGHIHRHLGELQLAKEVVRASQ